MIRAPKFKNDQSPSEVHTHVMFTKIVNNCKTSASRVTRSPSPEFKLIVTYDSNNSESSYFSPSISLTQCAFDSVKNDVAKLKNH